MRCKQMLQLNIKQKRGQKKQTNSVAAANRSNMVGMVKSQVEEAPLMAMILPMNKEKLIAYRII